MVLGMPLKTYTLIHVVISLIAIVLGVIVLIGMMRAKKLERLTWYFLVTTAFTSITGFGFGLDPLLPSHIVGLISLTVLVIAIVARYVMGMAGKSRAIYVITAVIALYLNVFVLVVQGFEKVAALKALAPTQKEPPFLIAQLVVMALFVVLGILAVKKFRPVQDTLARAA